MRTLTPPTGVLSGGERAVFFKQEINQSKPRHTYTHNTCHPGRWNKNKKEEKEATTIQSEELTKGKERKIFKTGVERR